MTLPTATYAHRPCDDVCEDLQPLLGLQSHCAQPVNRAVRLSNNFRNFAAILQQPLPTMPCPCHSPHTTAAAKKMRQPKPNSAPAQVDSPQPWTCHNARSLPGKLHSHHLEKRQVCKTAALCTLLPPANTFCACWMLENQNKLLPLPPGPIAADEMRRKLSCLNKMMT